MQKNTCLLAACLLYTLAAFAQKKVEAPYPITKQLIADKAIVVSAHPLATAVGVSVLRQGGNAVDAAIATQFALAVVYPRAGNIGGGGFMLLRAAKSKIEALDYRETAPKAAYKTMYLDGKQQVIANLSTTGGLASGTPGSVAGMWAAHQKYGKLAWRKLVEPAIKLARNGIQLTAGEAKTMSNYAGDFAKAQTLPSAFTAKKVWLKAT